MKMILLVVAAVCLILLGHFIMGRLDRFMDSCAFKEANDECAAVALVLVDEQRRTEVERALAKHRNWIRYISEPAPPGEPVYEMALAVSGNDQDNILLCAQLRKVHSVLAVALCNNPQYQFVYRDYGIEHVALNMDEALSIFEGCLKERFERND